MPSLPCAPATFSSISLAMARVSTVSIAIRAHNCPAESIGSCLTGQGICDFKTLARQTMWPAVTGSEKDKLYNFLCLVSLTLFVCFVYLVGWFLNVLVSN